MKKLLLISLGMALVVLYLLAMASANTSRFTGHYNQMLIINIAVLTAMVSLVGYQLWQLRKKLKAGIFGSKLTLRLVMMFALVAVLPGALVYLVSFQFLTKSIDTWFDVKVDTALDRGLSLGQVALDHVRQEQEKNTLVIARQLADKKGDLVSNLYPLQEQTGVHQLGVFTARGTLLAFAGPSSPDNPTPLEINHVRTGPVSTIESDQKLGLFVRVLVPLSNNLLGTDSRILVLQQPVPKQLAEDADALESIRSDYKSLMLSRGSLQTLYTVTLTLSLLLALLSVLALAFFLSDRLSAPLTVLAAGTRAVAQGDYSQRHAVQSRDELGMLTLQFNRMTRQLAEARDSVEHQQLALTATNEYLESLLANLTTGVLAFDVEMHLRSANTGAGNILGVDIQTLQGKALSIWQNEQPLLADFAVKIGTAFKESMAENWQAELVHEGPKGAQTLLLRGSHLPSAEHGFVLVFDDITDLIQAQRQAAWGEVARRLAHEIKNPLTPIQLSAERLQFKLAEKLSGQDVEMLNRSTQTIVNQVAALKNMVEDFKEYARAPKQRFSQLDFHELIQEVLTLYESGNQVKASLPSGPVFVNGDATRLRQVLHNLLQNAQDAVSGVENPEIQVKTLLGTHDIQLTVSDNGAGFPADLMTRIFEPYVTTKAKGTGLGLAIVKKICEEHHGSIQIQNREPNGAQVTIVLPRLQEQPEEAI